MPYVQSEIIARKLLQRPILSMLILSYVLKNEKKNAFKESIYKIFIQNIHFHFLPKKIAYLSEIRFPVEKHAKSIRPS